MPESVTPMIPVLVEYRCDDCGTPVVPATIRDIGRDGLTLHQCPECGDTVRLAGTYPNFKHVNFLDWMRECKELLDV